MKLHLPVLLRKAVLACFSVAFAYSMSSGSTAAAALTLGGDDSLAVDCADPSSITDLAGGTLTLAGGTELRISNCGTGDGKTYTLLTSVSGLLDDEGNVISLDSSNNAIANYFDTTQPGTGFWADAILVLTDDDTLQLVRYSEPVKDVLTITSRKTTGVTYLYYTGVKASGISSSYDGGAIYDGTSGAITLNNNGSVTFSNNVARSKNGGVIYGNNTITLSNNGNVTSSNNSASRGGVIYGNNTITLSNNGSVKFSGNVATSYGGAIYGNNTITLSNNGSVEFDGNKTTATSGGGAAIYGGTVTLSNNELVRFSSNQSTYGSVDYGYTSSGGAIRGERIELSNNGSVIFNKNTAYYGGAIYGYQSVLLNGNGNIEFTETSTGGAIGGQSVILSNNGNIKFESSTSTTSSNEHAIWYHTHSTGEIALRNNNFVSFIGFSSAIHVKGNINVSENVEISFAQNSAQHGGAIYNIAEKGIVEFSKNHDILFSENAAWKGGAIYHIGDIDFFENTGIISFASNGSIPGYTSSGTSESAFGGAIYAGGVLSFTDNQEIVFESNKSDLSVGYYEYDSAGGATYSTEANFINNSKVVFSNNSNIRRNSSYENDSYGGAVYVSNNLLFDNNDKVSFSGNYTEGDARGGAIYAGTEVQFINNGIIIFENNRTISGTGDSYNHGGAIYTKKIDLVNNQKISFKGNYEKNAAGNYRLRSLYIGNTSATTHDGSALFSSAYSDGVEFFDPFYINGDLRLNEKYTTADHVEIPQIGDIVISALYTDDALYYAKGNIDGSATELMNSKTSEVIGVTHLYDGRLRVEDGAIFEAKGGIQLHSSVTGKSTPTLYLRNSSLRGSTLLLEQGSLLELTGKNTATFTTFQLDDSGSVTFHMNEENADFAVLRLSGAFEQQGALTLNISFNDSEAEAGLYKLLTVTSIADDSLWTTSNVTVNGLDGYVVSFDDLEWKDNTLYLNYNGTPGTGGATTPTLLIATWTNEAGDGLWNGTSLNWEQEEVDYAYKDGVQVVFGDEGAGTVTLVGDIAPGSVLVDSAEDYAWNADTTEGGKLTGSMSLTKKGTGSLTINTENDYTGGTTIQGGTVVAGTATALGIGAVSLTDATLKIDAEGVENALTTAGTSSILVQDGGSLALQSAITNAATGILTLSGKVDVSGIGELTKLDATLIDVNGNAGTSGFARTEGYTLQVVQGGKVLGAGAQLEHRDLPTGLTLVLGENGLATAGATTDFTKYAVTGSHAVSVSEILKDVPQDSALSSIEMSGGTLLVDAATDALSATAGTVTVNKEVTLGGTMSGGMLMAQAGEIAATLSGNTAVVVSGAVTLSGSNSHRGGVMLNGGALTLKHAQALGAGQPVTSGVSSLVIDYGVELSLGQAISNSGRLSISGSIDASGLALHSSAATRVDVNGVSGTSGFAKEAEQWVQIVNGGTTENKGVTILHSGTSDDLLLGADGRATYGGAIYHDEYLLTAGGAAGVREILNAGGAELIKITMEGGTLKVNADTSALLTATDGTILLVEGGTLGSGSSVSGVDIKANGGSIAATLTGSNTLEGIAGFTLSSTITNTGTLTISGSINADALTLTKGSETHIDVNGESGASGFLKTAVESVQLTSGAGSTIDGGVTITHKDATGSLVLGKDGVATRGGEIDYTHYLLNGETDSAKVSDIIADAGDALTGITVQQGTLTVDAVSKTITATGGAVVLDGGVLNGSVENTALTLTSGTVNASIAGGSIIGSDYALREVLQVSGNVEVRGSFNASLLQLVTENATRIDVDGNSGASGFFKSDGYSVLVMNGGTLEVADGTKVKHGELELTLGSNGYATAGGSTDLSNYLLTGTDSVSVGAVLDDSPNATINMQGGTLTVDRDFSKLTTTAGTIDLNTDVELGGIISGTTIYASKGTLSAALNGNNTLVGDDYALRGVLSNSGTLVLSGSFTVNSLTTNEAATYIGADGVSGFAKEAYKVATIATGITADGGATIKFGDEYLKLNTDGTASKGGTVDYDTFRLQSDVTVASDAIHAMSANALVDITSGHLAVNDETQVKAIGGSIELTTGGILNGSLTDTELTLTAGTVNASINGGKVIGNDYDLNEILQVSGNVSISGSFVADALTLSTIDAKRVDVVTGNSGNSGFLMSGGHSVQIVNGGTLNIANGTIVKHGELELSLGSNGFATKGGTLGHEYLLTGNDTVNVAAILEYDPNATINMQGGTLTVDAATNALTATAGTVRLDTDVTLGGSISGATVNASAGTLAAALSGNNTLVGKAYALSGVLNNSGTLTMSGTFTVNSLTTDEAATYVGLEGCSTSGFAKEAYKVATIATGATADAGATITYKGEVLKLNTNGTASKGGTVDYSTFWLKSDVTVASNAIHTQSANALVNITAGKLMVKDETRVQANGGSVELVTGGVLNGSLSGTELTLKAGTVNASIADGSIIGSDYALSEVLQVSGNVSISGSFVADALTLTTIDTKRVDVVEGNSGNSGFLKHGDSYVQIISGDTLDIADGTIVKHGSIDLTLGADGYARSAGGTEWGEYLLTGSDKVSTNMIHTGEGAWALVRQEGGQLRVNDTTEVKSTSGEIILSGATLSGEVADTRVTAERGSIAATLSGITAVTITDEVIMSGNNTHSGVTTLADATLTITHANALGSGDVVTTGDSKLVVSGVTLVLGDSISNTGKLKLSGSFDASGLTLNRTEEGRMALSGTKVSRAESGFARGVEYSVQIVEGGKTLNDGVSISHRDYLSRTQLVLGEDGVARAGGGVDYSRFFLTGADAVSVSEVDAVSELKGSDLLSVNMDGGELEVDADITVEASGGSIVITDDSTLRGAIAHADITAAAGDYTSDISADVSGGSKVTVIGGEVTLSGANRYTGGTVISGGSLTAGSDTAFGTGEVELRGGVLELSRKPLENKLLAQGGIISGGSGFRGTVVFNGTVGLRGNLSARSMTINSGSVLTLNGSTVSVSGSLTLGGSAVLNLNGSDFGDGDVLITFGSLSGSEDLLTVTYGADSDKYGVEKKGNALILAWLEEPQPEEEEKPAPLPPTEPDIPEQPVPALDRESCDALVQSSWGVFTASHAFADAIGGQRSAAGYVGRQECVAWVSALGGMHRIDGTSVAAGSDIDLFGAAVGMEHYMSATDTVGIAVGHLSGDVKLKNSGRETEQSGTYFGLYGVHQLADFDRSNHLNLRWSAVYGDTETEGSIGQEKMSMRQDSVQLNARVDWASQLNDAWAVNVFAGMEYFASESAENEESEEARVRMGSIQNLRGELGIGTRYTSGSTSLYGEVRYLNDMVRSNPYADINGVRGYGANPGRQGIGVTLGAQQELGNGWSVHASYSLEAMSEATMHSANIGAALRF